MFLNKKNLYKQPDIWILLLVIIIPFLNIFAQKNENLLKIRGSQDDPPFEFIEHGKNTGFDVDLMKAVAQVMDLDIEIQLRPWYIVRELIENGEIDAVTGMYYSEERDKLVDFSSPYLIISSDVFIRKGSKIKSLDDLKDKEIIVEKDGFMHDYLLKNNINTKIIPVNNVDTGLQLLASGQHDCSMSSKIQGLYFIEKNNLSNLININLDLPYVQNCFAVNEGNINLLTKLNEGLHILKTTGEYKKIHDKWFAIYTQKLFWKKIQYFIYAIIIITILLITILSWNYLLRNQVKKYTEEMRQIIDLVPHMIFAKDIKGKFLLVNKSFAEFYNMTTEEMTGKNEKNIHQNKKEIEKYQLEDLEVIKSNKSKFIENIIISPKTHEEMIIDTTKIPFISSHTNKKAILGIAIDTTTRKKQEKLLKESQRRYSSIFQTVSVAILEDDISELKNIIKKIKAKKNTTFREYLDKNPNLLHEILVSIKIINVNKETLKFYQAKDKQELVSSLKKTVTPNTLQVYKKAVLAIAEGKEQFESEIEYQTLSGDPKEALLKITIPPLKSESNRLLLSMMDITRLKEVEAEIRKFNVELEERVKKRTMQLQKTNQSLEKALTKLEEDEEAGRELQEQLLPKNSMIFQQYKFSSKLMPSLYLSGDFIDYFKIDKNHIGFYFIDVSGHGISSAFITVLIKSYFSQYVKMYHSENNNLILNPNQVLIELNKEIIEKNLAKYLTIFYAVVDQKENKLNCCNGGQFPFPIYYNGEKTAFLQNVNLPVGLYDFAEYQSTEITINKDFSILLISDGILDVLLQNSLKDKEKFLLSLLHDQETSFQSVLDKLNFINQDELPDDITFCMLQKIPDEQI